MFLSILLWQTGGMSSLISMLPLLGMFVVFYFFMIRPQMNRQKAQVEFQSSLQKGEEVVTSSGIIGKISAIQGNVVTLQLGDKIFIKVLSSAISKEMTTSYASGTPNEVVANS